jgi:hypothetical protein
MYGRQVVCAHDLSGRLELLKKNISISCGLAPTGNNPDLAAPKLSFTDGTTKTDKGTP